MKKKPTKRKIFYRWAAEGPRSKDTFSGLKAIAIFKRKNRCAFWFKGSKFRLIRLRVEVMS